MNLESMCSTVNFVIILYFRLPHPYFVRCIFEETNTYADQCESTDWICLSSNEFRVFLAVNFLQSVVQKPQQQMYWTKNPVLETPFVRKCMPFKRFQKIKQYLHFVNNRTYDEATHPNPKLNKIWPVYSRFVEKCKSLYTPDKDVTIDESLMLYKGRLGWVQYIPLKRARFGIKYYMLCESKSGFVCDFIIYTEASTIFDAAYNDLPVSTKVVMTLMKPLLNQGYCLTVDNFYTSPQLGHLLVQNQTGMYGTVRLNRKNLPVGIKKEKLRKGEVSAYIKNKMVLKWKDKKDVTLLSTIHNAEMVDVTTRKGTIQKPKLVMDYNNTMGGVDQHLSCYPTPRKKGKKYYKIFFHLVDLELLCFVHKVWW